MSAKQGVDRGVPQLLAGSGEPFALRWSGDPELGPIIACEDARAAAEVLVGSDRSTRPVVRYLACSISGPSSWVNRADNANLFPMSVVLAVDALRGRLSCGAAAR